MKVLVQTSIFLLGLIITSFSFAEGTAMTNQPSGKPLMENSGGSTVKNPKEGAVQPLAGAPVKASVDSSDPSAEFFFYHCAGCHTVGGGKLTGPDLTTASKWSDTDLGVAIKKMEKNTGPLSTSDITQMIQFLKDLSVTDRISKQKEKVLAKLQASLPPPSYDKGKRLFRGQRTLQNGGPACISCHHFVNEGGALGPDLTLIKDKASGVVLQSAIENSSYKIMRSIYGKQKITPEEALHLSEYLSHPEKAEQRFSPTTQSVMVLAWGCVGGFVALLIVLNQRRKGLTRRNLLQKYIKR